MNETIIKEIVREIVYKVSMSLDMETGDNGVFEKVEDAIDAAYAAQKLWYTKYKMEDRRRIIEAVRAAARENAKMFARMIRDETGMGRYEDKVTKILR